MVRPTQVSNSFRALRFANGDMTQAELVERLRVTCQTVIVIEQGGCSPSLETTFRIACVFEVPLDSDFHDPGVEGESA